jgi:putative nucleotidyltransferase with HDIG domain
MPIGRRLPVPRSDGPNGVERRFALFGLALALLLGLVLIFPLWPGAVGPEVRVGLPAPRSIKSPVTIRYVSEILTEADREAAAAAVAEVYRFDPSITLQARQSLSQTLGTIGEILFAPQLDREAREQRLEQLQGVSFSTSTLNLLLILQPGEWEDLVHEALRVFDELVADPLRPAEVRQIAVGDLSTLRRILPDRVSRSFYPAKRALVAELVAPFLAPNYLVDATETERRRQEARARTPARTVQVLEGELILQEGQIVRDVDVEKLEAVGLRNPSVAWPDALGRMGLVLALVGGYTGLLYRFQPELARNFRRLILLGLVLLVTAIVARLLIPGRVGVAYAFPAAAAAMVLTLLLGPLVSLGATLVLAVLIGQLWGNSLELAAITFTGSLLAILCIHRAQRFSTFFYAGLGAALGNLLVFLAFRLISGKVDLGVLLKDGSACLLSGFLSAALAFATFGLLGQLSGEVTVLQLMELSNPNHPLLRRLMQEAPGTYYHSIVVGNLAERAAELVGADPLLVRVGAYFHDVGKLARPYFFIDNQAGRTNIHDELPPRTSAQLIIDHVQEGLELARKYRLPEQITRFIAEHHGTTLASFFYRRALQEEETVDPGAFRYPGPKPQSREAAILMLADSVEATVRAMSQTGKLGELLANGSEEGNGLARLVGGIIEERLRDGQLDECDLSLRDLRTVQNAFVSILRGIYHPRIVYPELGKPQEAST